LHGKCSKYRGFFALLGRKIALFGIDNFRKVFWTSRKRSRLVAGAYRLGDRADLLADYRLRWDIESLFDALKSRGFDLESTHLHHPERLERLLALLALAFGWAHRTGVWVAKHVRAPRLIAKYDRRAKSVFRLGLDALCQLLAAAALRPRDRRARFRLFARFLSCV
jgi:hypothetical protein